ncbi:hypothetical protein AVEN_248487-1 [Araneus ventricosus]|uniref:Uncharacterized protein n=1 Tax=Araneus ventricosus TaxID=182803 RepID=A0A4Y2PD10_ARAVE|nr:hypothetical protein AVEN_248487-1 [Araneus ventricosus]
MTLSVETIDAFGGRLPNPVQKCELLTRFRPRLFSKNSSLFTRILQAAGHSVRNEMGRAHPQLADHGKGKRPMLWIRSDESRITELFRIASAMKFFSLLG